MRKNKVTSVLFVLFSCVFWLAGTGCAPKKSGGSLPDRAQAKPASVLTLPTPPSVTSTEGMTIFDIPVLLASATYLGKRWAGKERVRLEEWLSEKIDLYLEKGHLRKAYNLWAQYAASLEAPSEKADDRVLSFSRRLITRFLKQGGVAESLHIAIFLEGQGLGKYGAVRKRILSWYAEMDAIEYKGCFSKEAESKKAIPGRCHMQRKGDEMFQQLIKLSRSKLTTVYYWEYLCAVYGMKSPSPDRFSLAHVAHLPAYAQKEVVIRVAGLLLFAPDPVASLTAFAKLQGLGSLAPWLKSSVEKMVAKDAVPSSLSPMKSFFSVKLGDGFSRQVCAFANTRYPGAGWVSHCYGQHSMSLANSLVSRNYMTKAIKANVMLKEAWDAVFTISLKRFYHFIEREHLTLARAEAAYLVAFHKQAMKYWEDGDFRFNLATIAMALSDLYLIRGQVKEAQAQLMGALKKAPSAGLLNSLIRIAYWNGDYARVLQLFEKYKELPADNGYSVYLFMKMARYNAWTREKMGNVRHARMIRFKTVEYYLRIFRQLPNRDLQAELLVEAGKIYLDENRVKLGVQFFQYALDRTESCGVHRTILQHYIAYGMIKEAVDVYNSLMGQTSCTENRQLYASLWIYLLAKRKGVDLSTITTATDFLKSFKGDPWLMELARMVSGSQSLAVTLKKARHLGQQTEAWFYGGYRLWAEGKKKQARALFRKVIESKIFIYSEFEMAHHLLTLFAKEDEAESKKKKSL